MSSDKLRLNDLDRFRKSSSRLALEVHSHCEVPAGCGGVVLRWRRPGTPIGLAVMKHIAGAVDQFWLDGEPLEEQRPKVAPGDHVLSFVVEKPGPDGVVLWKMTLNPAISTAARPEFLSGTSGRWVCAVAVPPEGWQLPTFDDSMWLALVERPVAKPDGKQVWSWQFLKERAKGLGLPPDAPPVERLWVRCAFHVDDGGFA